MRKPVNLNNLDINKKEQVFLSFLSPENIYLPVNEATPSIKKRVLKNEEVFAGIYSSVSGEIIKTEENLLDLNKVKTVVIANDFKEEGIIYEKNKFNLEKITKDELIANLEENQIKTTKNELLKELLQREKEVLIIKCFDDEVGIANASYILDKNIEKLLTLIDKLSILFNYKKVLLMFKNKDSAVIAKCKENIGTFPNINTKLINDFYPLRDEFINSLVFLNDTSNNSLILSIYDIYRTYLSLRNSLLDEPKIITISGNALDKTYLVETKVGVKINDVLASTLDIKENNYVYYINSYLPINKLDNIANLVVTKDFKGIFLNKKEEEEACINCGKCYNICPVYINPKDIKREKCIKCGLCSFYCPSHIDLLEKMRRDEHV